MKNLCATRKFKKTNHKYIDAFRDWARARPEDRLPVELVDDGSTDESNRLGAVGDLRLAIATWSLADPLLVAAGDTIFEGRFEPLHDRMRAEGATIETQGLLGDKFIYVSIGSESEPVLENKSTIKVKETPSMFALVDKASDIMDNIDDASKSVKDILDTFKTEEGEGDFKAIVSSIRKITTQAEKGRGLVHALFYDPKGEEVIDNLAYALKGVGDVTYLGQLDYSMRAWLDPDRMAARDLSASDVAAALREQNVQVAAGSLGRPPVPQGQAFQVDRIPNYRPLDPVHCLPLGGLGKEGL